MIPKPAKYITEFENLAFSQSDDKLKVNFTGMNYGTSYCVRVAEAEI